MSDAVLLALIKEIGGWISAVGGIFGAWALLKSRKVDKKVETHQVESEQKFCKLEAQAEVVKAVADHVQETVVQEREENRKQFYQIAQRTDVFMAQATAAGDSGRTPLQPLTDFNDLKLEDKP